ncbi:MAG: ribosome biogenesis GTPase YlqF [Tissierellia bacterium]|nr:ribosome biogenesis GTPase YlqF [Tissierellia bacterium]
MNINWYPGHMVKTKKDIKNSLSLVDIVLEIIDARIPRSSRNPMLDEILKDKPRMIILNKTDLAEDNENDKWIDYFKKNSTKAIKINSKENINTKRIYNEAKSLLKEEFERRKRKKLDNKKIKMMIVGIPNSGKSTFINNISNRKGTKIGNKPGVTKQKQWIKTNSDILLLDTPGILWPKFEDQLVARHLSYTYAIKDEIVNTEELAFNFIEEIMKLKPNALKERYGIEIEDKKTIEIYDQIAKRRGCFLKNKEIDYEKASSIILNDFRNNKLGKVTLERV